MTKIEMTISIKQGEGKAKTFQLVQTAKPVKGKNGKLSLAHFQPAPDNKIIKPFGKIYLDTVELSKSK
uniref:Uncharacterized protein n=1 Tax=viral metagenome TaxID=1070528 RepID=A0A6M3LXT1_9ZZZZ